MYLPKKYKWYGRLGNVLLVYQLVNIDITEYISPEGGNVADDTNSANAEIADAESNKVLITQ